MGYLSRNSRAGAPVSEDLEANDSGDEELDDPEALEIRISTRPPIEIPGHLKFDTPIERAGGRLPSDIIVIDFETATGGRSSACALGVAYLAPGGEIVSRKWLIRPPGDEYDGMNTSIHGIRSADTEDAPGIAEVWDEVHQLIGDRALVAHNADFDMTVLRHSMSYHGARLPGEYPYLCTYRLAQKVWPDRVSYRLDDIAADLGLDTDQHHEPDWDARAALEIAGALVQASGVSTLAEVAAKNGYRIGSLHPDPVGWTPFTASKWNAGDIEGSGEVDPGHPFFDRCVVITGALPNGMGRKEAYQQIVNIGGRVAPGVSKKVNILVVLDLDLVLQGMNAQTGKLKKAIELAEKGVDIELMSARDFCLLL